MLLTRKARPAYSPSAHAPPDAAERCVTCHEEVATPYCANCGERRASDRAYSLIEFAKDAAEAFLSFDGRLIRSLVTLLRKPGELTAAYMRGSRLPYLAPLQCFLILNLFYFAWATWAGNRMFDTPLVVHMKFMPYSTTATAIVNARLAARGLALPEFSRTFNAVGTAQAKSLVLIMVPMFALLMSVATLGRVRRYAVQHLVFALHLFGFLLCLAPLSHYLIDYPLVWILTRAGVHGGGLGFDAETSLALGIVFAVYLGLAMRRAYGMGVVRALVSAPLITLGLWVCLTAYRGILFYVTMASV